MHEFSFYRKQRAKFAHLKYIYACSLNCPVFPDILIRFSSDSLKNPNYFLQFRYGLNNITIAIVE